MSLEQAIQEMATQAARVEADLAEVKARQARIELQWLQVQGELREGQRRVEQKLVEVVDLLRTIARGVPEVTGA